MDPYKKKVIRGMIGLVQIFCFLVFMWLRYNNIMSPFSTDKIAILLALWGVVSTIKVFFIDWRETEFKKILLNLLEVPVGPAMIGLSVCHFYLH